MRQDPRTILFILAIASVSCVFSFDNPYEALKPGEVRGRVVAEREGQAGSFDPVPDSLVQIRGAPFSVRTRKSGFFAFFDLPPVGRVELLLSPASSSRALRREVDLKLDKAGQAEPVLLGDVPLRYTAALKGTVLDPSGRPAASASVVDDASGSMVLTDAAGRFQLSGLALGSHRLRVFRADGSEVLVGGVLLAELSEADQRSSKDVGAIPTRLASGQGRLSASLATIADATAPNVPDPASLSIDLVGPSGNLIPLTADSHGRIDDSALPEGVYSLRVQPPANLDSFLPPPVVHNVVVLQGHDLDLGHLFLADEASVLRAENACETDADCAPGSCVAGQCVHLASDAGVTCVPESDAELCQRLGRECGEATQRDNCGQERTFVCGTCADPLSCSIDGLCRAPGRSVDWCILEDAKLSLNPVCTGSPAGDSCAGQPEGAICDEQGTATCKSGICTQNGATSCVDGVGQPLPDGTACDDGKAQTTPDQCVKGSCVGTPTNLCLGKTAGAACHDDNPRTIHDQCSSGAQPAGAKVLVVGVTDSLGAGAELEGQVGWGLPNTNGSGDPSWTWMQATYASDDGDTNDRYVGLLAPVTQGSFAFAFRFRYQGGQWTYCDLDSSSNGFSIQQQGALTVGVQQSPDAGAVGPDAGAVGPDAAVPAPDAGL